MAAVTDPAREIADLCTKLMTSDGNRQQQGSTVLAAAFNVEEWSSEFYQVIFAVSRNADKLIEIIQNLNLDPDTQSELVGDVEQIQQAFSRNGLVNQWQHTLNHYLTPSHVKPIKALSMQVRGLYAFPKLNADELDELLGEVDELLSWLNEHQLKDQDFIRQAIIEGLEHFRFRAERVGWVGWGYALQSLREVIGAYLALERGLPETGREPAAEAVLKKTAALVQAVYSKVDFAKSVMETGDFVLKAYGAFTLASQGPQGIKALLTQIATVAGSG